MTRNRRPVVLALVLAMLVAPVAAGPAGGNGGDAPTPGETFGGSVAAQGAELQGEVAERSFGVRIRNATTDRAKAAAVAAQTSTLQQRLERLREQKRALQEGYQNGTVSRARYRTEMAELAASTAAVRTVANESARVARGLPDDVLADRGVDVAAIEDLRGQAGDLAGPEVAEIARSVAGPDVGKSMGGTQRPEDLPGPAGNRSTGPGNGTGTGGSDTGNGPGDGTGNGGGPGNDGGSSGGPGAREDPAGRPA